MHAGGRTRLPLAYRERLERLRVRRRRFVERYGTWSHLAQFLVVGASGLVVNLAVLTGLLASGSPRGLSVGLAIAISMLWNFCLNRRFSFSYARGGPVLPQLAAFAAACSVGATVNYVTTVAVWEAFRYKQLAASLGIGAGTAFNFVTSRFLVFRARTVPPGARVARRSGSSP